MHIQEAVKKETVRIAAGTAVGVLVMFAVFFGLHIFMPESVPFDYKVILGGLGGGFVAVLNFFLMSLMVQKVTSIEDRESQAGKDLAYATVRASFRNRMAIQILWMAAALAAPCFNGVSGIAPLLFPSAFIKLMSIFGFVKT